MNKQEIIYIMTTIKTAYPNFYRDSTEISDAVNLWGRHLADDDFNLTIRALDQYIADDTGGFPPAIGQIKDLAKHIKRKQREELEMQAQQKRLAKPKKEPSKEDMEMASEFINKIRNSMKLPREEQE